MSETLAPRVVDVSTATFEEEVVRRSAEVPVLVDFWAPWCGPCHFLGRVLEKLAAEMEGAFVLARVNSDENPELVARFGVRSIPYVQLVKDGWVMDEFVGARLEAQVRAFLRPWCPTAADRQAAEGARLATAGEIEAARSAFETALGEEPDHGGALLGLARLALAAGAPEEAASHLAKIPSRSEGAEAAEDLRQTLTLAREALEVGDAETCRRRLEADGGDLEARFALGGHALAAGRYREALEHFLELARRDRRWHDEAARRAAVTVFRLVGVRDPLAEEFREHLTAIYY